MELPNILWVTDQQIPTVDARDIKALYKLHTDLNGKYGERPGVFVSVGLKAVEKVLTPGANVSILVYRLGWLRLLQEWNESRPQEFPWIHDGKVEDAVFEALAVLPMRGIANGGLPGPAFDTNELLRLIKAGA